MQAGGASERSPAAQGRGPPNYAVVPSPFLPCATSGRCSCQGCQTYPLPSNNVHGCLTRAQTLQADPELPNRPSALAAALRAASHAHMPYNQVQGCQTCPSPQQQRSGLSHKRTTLATRPRAAKHAHCPCNNSQGCLTRAQASQPGLGLPNMPIAARQQRSGLSHKRTTLATRTRPAKHAHCPCNSSQGWLTRAQPLGVPNHPRVRAGEESVG